MNSIRKHITSRVFAFVTALAFLNMSFFLAEVSFFNLEKGELLENIAKLVLNAGFEEERDCESSSENTVKETLLIQQVHIHNISSFIISIKAISTIIDHYRHANHSLIFSPPPDFQHFS